MFDNLVHVFSLIIHFDIGSRKTKPASRSKAADGVFCGIYRRGKV
jgi:hypothetical protein